MIVNGVVRGGAPLETPEHLSFGKYVIDKWRSYRQDTVALIDGISHQEVTYGHLLQRTVSIATGLKELGLQHGDVVALCSENCSDYIAATIGILCAGASLTTINVKYTRDDMLHVFNLSKPRLVFCSKSAIESKLEIIKEASCVEFIVNLYETADSITTDGSADKRRMSLESLMADCDVNSYEPERVDGASDVGFILYSSGTTGLPKGVMHTHLNLLYGCLIYNYTSENNSRILTVTPWYHIYGLLTTIQLITTGNLVVFLPEFATEIFLKSIEIYKIEEILAVPPIVVIIAKSSLAGKYDLSSVERVFCAAAPLSASTIHQAMKNLPNCKAILQGYGMTETTLVVVKEPLDTPGVPGCCGQPLPGVEAKVLDVNTRENLGPNEAGEICLKSPSLMKGYIRNEKATRDIFDEEGYIKTGDIGYYDCNGSFYVVDRIKDIIKYKGQQVAPAAVESVVLQHSGVAECGVVGRPDELAGELPSVFVVPKPGAALTEQDILDFTTSKLSPMSKIRGGVIFIKEIPRNGSGKILRRELRKQLTEQKLSL